MGWWSRIWSGIKSAGRLIGSVASAPFRAVGRLIASTGKKVVGTLAKAGEQGGAVGVIKAIGEGAKDVAQKIVDTPVVQATPLGRIAQGVLTADKLQQAIRDKDVKGAFEAGKSLKEQGQSFKQVL